MSLGSPRVHLRELDSTNDRARRLAAAGAPHGTLVTTGMQTAGRGRQGRTWSAPAGHALLMSLVLRDPPDLVPLRAGVGVARAIGDQAQIKWPNDVLVAGRKVCGILAEGRPAEGWAVLGIGVNVAVRLDDLPPELRETAGTLGRPPADLEPFLTTLLAELDAAFALSADAMLDEYRGRDALYGRGLSWGAGKHGHARGIADDGSLIVEAPDGTTVTLSAGEVHLALH